MPPDEQKQVGPDQAKPCKHDTGRGIILGIMSGGTPVLDPDQHPVESLMLRLVGPPTSSHRPGAVHVRSHWRRLPSGPETGPHGEDHGCPGFSNGFTAKVTMFTTIQGIGCGRIGRFAGMRWRGLSRMRQKARGGSVRPHGRDAPTLGNGPPRAVNGSTGMITGGCHG